MFADPLISWVMRLLGYRAPLALQLVPLDSYRKPQRMAACGEIDPLEVVVAYAQNRLVYTGDNRIEVADEERYRATDINHKVNKFGQAYRADASLLLHRRLADVAVDAAIDLRNNHGWRLRVYDGLRTVDAAQTMYENARRQHFPADLLAAPGKSAHNRALAVDSSLVDAEGREIERFDNLVMTVNHRDYKGDAVSAAQLQARIVKERAFQRAAIKHGLALAPLASEYWDDRVPGAEADLWRVIASLARVTGQPAPAEQAGNYTAFARQWQELNRNGALVAALGPAAANPPPAEAILFHEYLPPLSDCDLPAGWRLAAVPVSAQQLKM